MGDNGNGSENGDGGFKFKIPEDLTKRFEGLTKRFKVLTKKLGTSEGKKKKEKQKKKLQNKINAFKYVILNYLYSLNHIENENKRESDFYDYDNLRGNKENVIKMFFDTPNYEVDFPSDLDNPYNSDWLKQHSEKTYGSYDEKIIQKIRFANFLKEMKEKQMKGEEVFYFFLRSLIENHYCGEGFKNSKNTCGFEDEFFYVPKDNANRQTNLVSKAFESLDNIEEYKEIVSSDFKYVLKKPIKDTKTLEKIINHGLGGYVDEKNNYFFHKFPTDYEQIKIKKFFRYVIKILTYLQDEKIGEVDLITEGKFKDKTHFEAILKMLGIGYKKIPDAPAEGGKRKQKRNFSVKKKTKTKTSRKKRSRKLKR